jgi:hypothetical protein
VPVVYELQRREEGGASFHGVGSVPDLVLDILAPIESGDKVLFRVNTQGQDAGKYRVRVSYIADEAIYQLYRAKWPDLTEEESMRMVAGSTDVYSSVFRIADRNKSDRTGNYAEHYSFGPNVNPLGDEVELLTLP